MACPDRRLALEADGPTHFARTDTRRRLGQVSISAVACLLALLCYFQETVYYLLSLYLKIVHVCLELVSLDCDKKGVHTLYNLQKYYASCVAFWHRRYIFIIDLESWVRITFMVRTPGIYGHT
jgi:hypothetical protein